MGVRFKISTVDKILTLWGVLTIIIYSCVCIPPQKYWIAGMVSHLIPITLLLNFLLAIIFLIIRKRYLLTPLILLIIGWTFISKSIAFTLHRTKQKSDITILSYNVKLFRSPGVYDKFSPELIKWVGSDESDIKCLQEYSSNNKWPLLDATSQLESKGYYSYIFKAKVRDDEHNPGLAIFSKYKIINSGIVFEDKYTINASIFIDIELKNKIIRIYNVHLSSMNLELENSIEEGKMNRTIKRLKSGMIKRNEQLEVLIRHFKQSKYPIIICGDFNETPYSYVYNRLSESLQNSFNEAGNGFGFTLNNFPYILRIDHQFHSNEIQASMYKVDYSIRISDHFPTYGFYRI